MPFVLLARIDASGMLSLRTVLVLYDNMKTKYVGLGLAMFLASRRPGLPRTMWLFRFTSGSIISAEKLSY